MRWRFLDSSNPSERAVRDDYLHRIDGWWSVFSEHQQAILDRLRQAGTFDLPEFMDQQLSAIDPQLMWEFTGPPRIQDSQTINPAVLVITPESERRLRPLVASVLDRAPQLQGWQFSGYRLPESPSHAAFVIEGRSGCRIDHITVSASTNDRGLIDLLYHFPSGHTSSDRDQMLAAFIATEVLLGEQVLDRWIGRIETSSESPPPLAKLFGTSRQSKPTTALPLERLKPTVDAAIAAWTDKLPRVPYFQNPAFVAAPESRQAWVMKLNRQNNQEDYPAKQDLITVVAFDRLVCSAALSGETFYSSRYSRHGETFCYLKVDGINGLDPAHFTARDDIEQALQEVLVGAGAGAVIGLGTGSRYVYIDLALADLDIAVPLIRDRLQSGNIPKRTWIEFFDADLAAEWIGIYNDTPVPPGHD